MDELVAAARELLRQIDDGPRDCYGTTRTGEDVWKGSFLARVERLRALVPPPKPADDRPWIQGTDSECQ